MTESSREILIQWHNVMQFAAFGLLLLAVLIFLFYELKVSMIKDLKDRHDFINVNEIKWLKRVFFCISIATAFAINLYGQHEIFSFGVSFFVRLFFSIAGATLVGYVSSLILEYYYPTRLNKRLRKLRFAPRISSAGNKMKLLSEDEEDVHLDEGMQAEENIFSIDYDVWIDEKTKELKIEKYQGHLIALQCNNCGFYTMKVNREEIVERNPDGSPKELVKHYQCTYCKNVRATQFVISHKEANDYKTAKPKAQRNTRNIDLIKVDVHTNTGNRKTYEFHSVEEAQKFLNEVDADKIS